MSSIQDTVLSVNLSTGLSVNLSKVIAECRDLWERKNRVDVECCFRIGDLFDESVLKSANRPLMKKAFMKEFGEQVYQTFRSYAWVASRWPTEERHHTGKHSWSWYRDHTPNKQSDTAKEPKQFFYQGSLELSITGIYIKAISTSGSEVVIRVPWDHYNRLKNLDTEFFGESSGNANQERDLHSVG